MLCNIRSFGFWAAELGKVSREQGVAEGGWHELLRRDHSVNDLSQDKQLVGYIRHAAGLIEDRLGGQRLLFARAL